MMRHTLDESAGDRRKRLALLYEESRAMVDRFQARVRQSGWHPFIPAQYEAVERALESLWQPRLRFLEWGSANGTITIMADLLGFAAFGIEIDAELTHLARELATRFSSSARFATGSYLPDGYLWESQTGDRRLGTIGHAASAYPLLGQPLNTFDVVFAYPWGGEEPIMLDIMQRYGREDAYLLLQGAVGVETYRGGVRLN